MQQWQRWTDDDARMFISVPLDVDDKYSRGVLGVIAGSNQYPGAAVMACEGAMRAGVGMVRYLGPSQAEKLLPKMVKYKPGLSDRELMRIKLAGDEAAQ
jgi:NAD(P)H-hydrate repair Nnr-like enzyme with NAD(P)H-hydrate dehydratase domain